MTRKTIHDYVAVLGIAFCVAALAACSSEEQAGELPEADASLGISLGTAAGSLTKADADAEVPDGGYDGDKYARAHEFINSLWVYVVDAGGTVQAGWTLADGESWGIDNEVVQAGTGSPEGNIIRWIGPVKDLPAGRYTLYAFANLENYVSDDVKHSFTGQKTMLTENELSEITLEKPADKVDFAGTTKMYIPMSGKKEITLTRKNQTERIELVRLLSRVDVTVKNEKNEAVVFNNFTMGKFADEVGLMDMLNGTQTEFAWEYKKTFDPSLTVAAGETHSFSFYVPETAKTDTNQYVKMKAGNKTYSGLLTTSGILRNHVLPLNLILHDDTYALTVYAYIAPIGGYPVQVEVDSPSLTEGYKLTLPEGCSFRFVATKKTDGSTSAEEDCTLDVTDQTNGVIGVDGESWGHVTALPGQTGAIVVKMPGGSSIAYTVNITTQALSDWTEAYNLYNTRKP